MSRCPTPFTYPTQHHAIMPPHHQDGAAGPGCRWGGSAEPPSENSSVSFPATSPVARWKEGPVGRPTSIDRQSTYATREASRVRVWSSSPVQSTGSARRSFALDALLATARSAAGGPGLVTDRIIYAD